MKCLDFFSFCTPNCSRGLIFITLLSLVSCSLNDTLSPPSRADLARQRGIDNQTTGVAIEPFTSPDVSKTVQEPPDVPSEYAAELTWDMPSEPVDAFILYSGSSPDNLNTTTRVTIEDLRIIDGNKYRYLVRSIHSGEALYVSIAAENKGVVSEKSPVQKIEREGVRSEIRSQMAPRFLDE